MLSLDQLMTDVDGSVERRSGDERARALGRITDLFAGGAASFSAGQVELFDSVIQRFATAIETRARVELAERLARLAKAPPGILTQLAHDEIAVARPILTASTVLDDQTLMNVALDKGRDHMLAICERPSLSPLVTDVLVHQGDGVVRHAVAGNRGARFSASGAAALVVHSRADDALGALLSERSDLPPEAMRQLMDMAKETARARLLSSLPGAEREVAGAVERGAKGVGAAAPGISGARLALLHSRDLTETDLADLAGEDRTDEVVTALATMTGLSYACLERIFEERDNDLLIVIGKARGWSWPTVRALLKLRDPGLGQRHQIRRAEETFESLPPATASRVVHFLKVRETAGVARSERVRTA